MIDHTVTKFFETLFWIGTLLILASFFYQRWFVITILVGTILMLMTVVREGFRLKRATSFIKIVQGNKPKIAHRLLLLGGVIIVCAYLFLKRTLVADFVTQSYDLTQSPITLTWWVFVLIGIIIGLFILFSATKIGEVEYEKIFRYVKSKHPQKIKKERIISKKVAIKGKPSFFKKLFWEEESFWRRMFKPLIKKLEGRRAKRLKQKKIRIEQFRKKKLGELKKRIKEEKILIKEIKIKHPFLPRILITLFIFAMTIILVLHKKGKFSIENPIAAGTLGLILGLFALYIIVNVYESRKEKKLTEGKKERTVLQKIKKEIVAKASKYETDLDKLYRLINEVGSITVTEVAEGFGISKEQAEEWGRILESHDLIELNYPAIGELQLCKKKSKITK